MPHPRQEVLSTPPLGRNSPQPGARPVLRHQVLHEGGHPKVDAGERVGVHQERQRQYGAGMGGIGGRGHLPLLQCQRQVCVSLVPLLLPYFPCQPLDLEVRQTPSLMVEPGGWVGKPTECWAP